MFRVDAFSEQLDRLCPVVLDLACEHRDINVNRSLSYRVREALGPAEMERMQKFFIEFAHALLKIDSTKLAALPGFAEQCMANQHRHAVDVADADYVEYLTAISLVLYFLGLPFSQPWDRVLDLVKSTVGGLPNGACVAKAIGEIIRSARLSNRRGRQQRWATGDRVHHPALQEDEVLLIHSHMPIILYKSYVQTAEVRSCLPGTAHLLGHCYELVQMRLYASEGLPFRYLVPISLFSEKLASDAVLDVDQAWLASLDWLLGHVVQTSYPDQYVSLIASESLPPVFLNSVNGLFTSPRLPECVLPQHLQIPLPATFIRKIRVKLYRTSLMSLAVPQERNLLALRHLDDAGRIYRRHQLLHPYSPPDGAAQAGEVETGPWQGPGGDGGRAPPVWPSRPDDGALGRPH